MGASAGSPRRMAADRKPALRGNPACRRVAGDRAAPGKTFLVERRPGRQCACTRRTRRGGPRCRPRDMRIRISTPSACPSWPECCWPARPPVALPDGRPPPRKAGPAVLVGSLAPLACLRGCPGCCGPAMTPADAAPARRNNAGIGRPCGAGHPSRKGLPGASPFVRTSRGAFMLWPGPNPDAAIPSPSSRLGTGRGSPVWCRFAPGGWALAPAHAKSGVPAVVSGDRGAGGTLPGKISRFALASAAQTRRDHAAFSPAAAAGRSQPEPQQ